MSENEMITVELQDGRMFELESGPDPLDRAKRFAEGESVLEARDDGSCTVHPIHSVKAIHVGDVPRAGFGQRAKYRM